MDAIQSAVERVLAFAANPPLSDNPRSRDYCYTPCDTGLHACAYHPDGRNCLTLANMPCPSPEMARQVFEAAKAELSCAKGEGDDLVIDLNIDLNGPGGVEDDFYMSRQMLPRLARLWAGHPQGGVRDD